MLRFYRENPLILDLETTNLEFGSALNPLNRILLACWHFDGTHKHTWGGENAQQELLADIKRASFLVAHNAKFELQWLKRCGLELRDVLIYDTMLAEWVILGNEHHKGLSLEASCARHGLEETKDYVGHMIRLGIKPEDIPKDWLQAYCTQDVRVTKLLLEKQLLILEQDGLEHLIYQRSQVAATLADIEFNGIALDKKRVRDEYDKVLEEYLKAQADLEAEYGQINWRSRKQVAELLYDTLGFKEPTDSRGNPLRTDGGDRATDKTAISALKATSAGQKRFVQAFKSIANLNAKLTKSLEFFKGVCENYDGKFYGIFNQGTTATHRLSSSGRKIKLPPSVLSVKKKEQEKGIQLQNIPREYKNLITVSREDWELLDVDASQLEFRVAADLGDDPVAKQEIVNGVDIHTNTAKFFLDDGTQEAFRGLSLKGARQLAKGYTFKPLFGGKGKTPAEKAYCKFFQEKYSGIYKAQEGWTHEVYRTGRLITSYGMRFYWAKGQLDWGGRIANSTNIFDYPVQGMATGEIIPLVLWNVWKKIKDLRAIITLTVHDSIILEVHKDDVQQVKQILIDAFTKDIYTQLKKIYNYEFKTQLGCEIKQAKHWSEGPSSKHEAVM